MNYYLLSVEETLRDLKTDIENGLTDYEVESRLKKYGKNLLPEIRRDTLLQKFLRQFSDVLVIVLILAAVVSFILGERLDAYVVLAIVFLNAVMGYKQEAKAEKALDALKKLATTYCTVIREGNTLRLNTEYLVPGDVVLLESGDKVPADCRLIEAVNLEISESILTGESVPVKKVSQALSNENLPLADRLNMAFKDTTVLNGRGTAIVVGTGLDTEIGKISKLLQQNGKEEAPLEKELDKVGKKLSLFAGLIILVIFTVGIYTVEFSIREAFFTAVSLAVAAIPEGLPAIVTIVLAIGVARLSKVNAVIRKLNSVETLGSTNYILTDKTGTLTENKMTVTDIAVLDNIYRVTDDSKFIDETGHVIEPQKDDTLVALLNSAVLCSDVKFMNHNTNTFIGDSTEVALVDCAVKAGINVKELKHAYQRLFEIPFNSKTKKMLVAVKDPIDENKVIVIAKGAPEVIGWMVTTDEAKVIKINSQYTSRGLRSLAVSFKEISIVTLEEAIKAENPEEILSTYHTFIGILAEKDPLRLEVIPALAKARQAGIETIMLTGDNKLTAVAIAKEIGLIKDEKEAVDGSEIAGIDQNGLLRLLQTIKVFARVSPEQKLNVVQALKSQNNIVAVTGDGVNDAPAIKTADIGIAMGISGTDVSKEVSDMVLQDDNYATIVEAIKQGRIVYDNLIKFIRYLISCNISEILVVGIAVFLGLPLPLLPIQILWINLVTDGFPALSLGVEPGEKDIMHRFPRNSKEGLLTKNRWIRMIFESTLIAGSSLGVYIFALNNYGISEAQTAALSTLAFAQIFHTFNNRSESHSIFSKSLEPNPNLISTVVFSFVLQLAVIYTSTGNYLFKTVPLDFEFVLSLIGISLLPVIVTELYKFIMKIRSPSIRTQEI